MSVAKVSEKYKGLSIVVCAVNGAVGSKAISGRVYGGICSKVKGDSGCSLDLGKCKHQRASVG